MKEGLLATALAVAAGFSFIEEASAADQTGLGSNWPNAQDLSQNPSFHAYRWARDGVEFVQVNGSDGTPIAAVATDGRTVMVLPVGNPSIVTPAAQGAPVQGTPVYSDASLSIQAISSGLSVQPSGAAVCGDPIECSKPKPTPAAATAPTQVQALSCGDPIECSKPAAVAN